jgi:hypothetical protein
VTLAGFACLDRPAKRLFGGDQDRLIDRVGLDRQHNPFATTADDDGARISGCRDQHVVFELGIRFPAAASSEIQSISKTRKKKICLWIR